MWILNGNKFDRIAKIFIEWGFFNVVYFINDKLIFGSYNEWKILFLSLKRMENNFRNGKFFFEW